MRLGKSKLANIFALAAIMCAVVGSYALFAQNGPPPMGSNASSGGGGSAFPVTVSGTVNSGGIPCFTNATTESSSAAIGAGVLIAGGGAGACAAASHVTDNGTTVASTEPIVGPASTNRAFQFNGNNTGFSSFGAGIIEVNLNGSNMVVFNQNSATGEVTTGSTGIFDFTASTNNAATGADTSVSRKGAGMLAFGTGAQGSTAGFTKSAQSLAVTASDFTCSTGCTSLATITGLSATLPSVAANWSFSCHLIISQATAAAADQIGVQTATNASTNLAATAVAYTAAAVSTSGSLVGASSTSSQSVLTFTPGATGTNLPLILAGTVEGASASGTVLNIQILTGSSSDAISVKRGSTCWVY